jgi:5-methylcytosine-specific restriction endonuclease McrA
VTSYRHLYQSKRWKATSRAVLLRDGFRCATPGCTRRACTADHIVSAWEAFATGRPGLFWDMSNLRARCRECNSRDGARQRNARYRGVPRRRRVVATAEQTAVDWAAEYERAQERLRLERERAALARHVEPRIY